MDPINQYETSYIGILVITVIIIAAIIGFYKGTSFMDIANNWDKNRCDISVMPFASFYGKDAMENFNYCLSGMFKGKLGAVTGPFASILTTIIGSMMTVINNLNSARIAIGSLVGGVSTVFSEFTHRFNFLFNQVKLTSVRMQMLFNRLFSTFTSIIFMGSSAITAGQNFGDTFLFKFLDTFCFDPETTIDISGRGLVPVQTVSLGDICSDGSVITSVYRFYSRGQPMVQFDGTHGPILVSTNHYVKNADDVWIRSGDHVDAQDMGAWSLEKPLVCFDTNTHRIPIGGYIFSDYDETNASDTPTMKLIDTLVNNTYSEDLPDQYDWPYMPCLDPSVSVKMKDGSLKEINKLIIGDVLSTGTVIGFVTRHTEEYVEYNNIRMTPSTLVWVSTINRWVRAGFLTPVHKNKFTAMMPLVMNTCIIELENGTYVRDLMEVLSHDIEGPTEETLLGKTRSNETII